ncbi:glycosyl hydrolase 5 family protein [Coffea arabica]|uniref:Glycosyl hydrolase 5 family protein n=1 Tax=Coffea arabica TaxID=13443 RepID=A0ABM4VL29_COFAR
MQTLVATVLIFFAVSSHAVPLSTRSRWIIDESTGDRVKLVCANWEGHVSMLPEGLSKSPLDDISRHISLLGFNCIRLTWAVYMYTRHAHVTVAQHLQDLNLTDALAGIQRHNPHLASLTLVDAQKAVIESVASHGVMVILDCQVSKPMWCCNDNDGNGFWGDAYFDPHEWLRALSTVAKRYKDMHMVMAMSLRNELRGPRQNETLWYHWVEEGAKTIHRANPNVLVLVSGLNYDLDFRFLKTKPLKLGIGKKMVYEAHQYAFSDGQDVLWLTKSVNWMCKNMIQDVEDRVGFLFRGRHPAPLFITEFGGEQIGDNTADNYFLTCYISWLAENDLDWALWALQGSYYLRDGKHDPEETYGLFNSSWGPLRNPQFHTKLQLIQRTLIDPRSKVKNYLILYHPQSGYCAKVAENEVRATDCWDASQWSYEGEGTPIRLKGTDLCLTATGDGLPVALTRECLTGQSAWELAQNSQFQLASRDDYGNDLCLEFNPYYSKRIQTSKCIVPEEDDLQNPQGQWFKLIQSNKH